MSGTEHPYVFLDKVPQTFPQRRLVLNDARFWMRHGINESAIVWWWAHFGCGLIPEIEYLKWHKHITDYENRHN